jgi:hypothetical protein
MFNLAPGRAPMAVTMRGMIRRSPAAASRRGGRWRELRLVAEFTSQASDFAPRPPPSRLRRHHRRHQQSVDRRKTSPGSRHDHALLAWTFLRRHSRSLRAPAAHQGARLSAASGVFFWRFLRLALSAIFYGFLFAYVRGGLLDDAFTR